MRRFGIALSAAAVLVLTGCSSNMTNEAKKEASLVATKNEPAPDVFQVNLDTSKGLVVVEIHRDWAPIGVDHFHSLVKAGFYDGDRFFRYARNFIVQFGINGDPKINGKWSNLNIADDPVKESNVKGTLTYATAGPRTRSTQLFFNLKNNKSLDSQGFAPIGKVITGMDVVVDFYSSYGEMPSRGGQGPDPTLIETQGNEYLANHFPRLDFIKKATIQ